MKKWILMTLTLALPFELMAQDDDMYFVPTKENVAKEKRSWGMPRDTYYSGSQRSTDDYNRMARTSVTPIDSAGNDIIDFSAVRGVYPDSTYRETSAGDYQLTRRMQRFDDYAPSEAYWEGYRDGRWSSPWYSSYYYTWYDPWYDPWYYGYYGYAGYYGYYRPWYYYGYYPRYYYRYYRPRYYYGGTRYVRPSVSAGGYVGRSNGSYARMQRRTTDSSRSFGTSPSSTRSFGGSTRSFGGGGGNRSFGGGGGGGFRGGGGGGGRSFGSRR